MYPYKNIFVSEKMYFSKKIVGFYEIGLEDFVDPLDGIKWAGI